MRIRLLLVALVVAVAATLWLWPAGDVSPGAGSQLRAAETPQPSESARAPDVERVAAEAGADDAFVSKSEDGVVVEAVRDGVAILVLDSRREPLANAQLSVAWRKGFGMYGSDRGRTDGRGRFPTTIAEYEMIEGVTLDGADGELEFWFGFLPMANDPRTVLVIAAKLEPVTLRVIDQRGVPIAHAKVAVEGDKVDAVPREHVLVPSSAEVQADAEGRVALLLPPRAHTFKAAAEGYLAMYSLRAEPPFAGRTLTMHLLDRRELHDVAVTVVAPAAMPDSYWVSAWTRELPAFLPGIETSGVESLQMEFEHRRVAPREFVVRAPPLRWRCGAHVDGFSGNVDVGAFDTKATLAIALPPAPPVARLTCKLLLPDGQQTSGVIMVHETPDLVLGPRRSVSASDAVVSVPPAGKVCVSAWVYKYPPAVVGPIELTAGEHEVTFQFVQPLTIRGRAIDEQGKPARVMVSLRRPAEALRALAADAPAILASSASGDSLGTGEEGRFWFENLGVGEHELYVIPEGLGWPARVRVTPGDQDVVVRLGTGIDDMVRVQGRVTMAGSGKAVAGAQVRWVGDATSGNPYTDTDGRYAQVVKPGLLHPEVWARHCAVWRGDDEGLAIGLVTRDFVLAPSEPLFVRVRDADGKVPDVEVLARDEKGRELTFLDADGNRDGEASDLDGSGRVVLHGLPVAAFTLIVRENGDDDAKKQSQVVEVPANTPRDVELAILWKPARK